MNNKGFTLIELLAVIVVLTVLLIIAVPRVLNVIEESRKEALRITGENIIDSANKRLIIDSMTGTEEKTYTITDGEFVGESLSIDGELPDIGEIVVQQDGKISLVAIKGTYCIQKDFNEERVSVSIDPYCGLIEPPPEACYTTTDDGSEVTITDYNNSCSKDVVIPSIVEGLPVTTIGSGAFQSNEITSVTIPTSVTSIESNAFQDNQITNVTIPTSVTTIGSNAFDNNILTTITMPSNVAIVNTSVSTSFYTEYVTDNASAAGIYTAPTQDDPWVNHAYTCFSESVVGEGTTITSYNGSCPKDVIIPNTLNGHTVTGIGEWVFNGKLLVSVTLPSTLTSVGMGAFSDNQITSISIPSSVTSIGSFAFQENQLTTVTIAPGLVSIGEFAFADNIITSLSLPSGVTTIGPSAFQTNQIATLSLPTSLTSIGALAFETNRLTSLTVPNGVTTIGNWAFQSNLLTTVSFGTGLTSLGTCTFCTNSITSVTIPASVNIISDSIHPTFYTAYVTNNSKAAGTYTAPSQSGTWTKQS